MIGIMIESLKRTTSLNSWLEPSVEGEKRQVRKNQATKRIEYAWKFLKVHRCLCLCNRTNKRKKKVLQEYEGRTLVIIENLLVLLKIYETKMEV